MTRDEQQNRPERKSRWGARPALRGMRPVITLALGCVLVILAYLELDRLASQPVGIPIEASGAFVRHDPESHFRSLTGADLQLLRRQRDLVNDLARRHVGSELTGGSLDDLEVLQRILDADVLDEDDTFELQSLGVALGDVMKQQLGLSWTVYHDELGESHALRLGETDTVVFPVTMISKRVEGGVPFRVAELYQKGVDTVTASPEAEPAPARPVPPPRPKVEH